MDTEVFKGSEEVQGFYFQVLNKNMILFNGTY